jgi:predicted DCC family thiol-disulfide oxidoreductase YuxK
MRRASAFDGSPEDTLDWVRLMKMTANIVLYDDQCPMCTFQMRVLTWLDWFNVTTLLPMSNPRAHEVAPSLTSEDLSAAIHCVTPDGRIYRGARCIRFVGMRMPLLIPVALILWVPCVMWIAERIYAWVSRNRYVLSKVFGCKEACAVLPERKRKHEKEVHPVESKT